MGYLEEMAKYGILSQYLGSVGCLGPTTKV
jgi:hypothetical protein